MSFTGHEAKLNNTIEKIKFKMKFEPTRYETKWLFKNI